MTYPGSAPNTRAESNPQTPLRLTVYGDFNCPYSYLASQRVNDLADRGVVQVDWRAVEHDRDLAPDGIPTEADQASWARELGEVAVLALAGERPASAVPPTMSNTKAALSAYAGVIADESRRAMRERLFDAIWVQHRNVSSEHEVQRVAGVALDSADEPSSAGARVRQWEQQWRLLPSEMVPTLVDSDGSVHRGVAALARLAELGASQ